MDFPSFNYKSTFHMCAPLLPSLEEVSGANAEGCRRKQLGIGPTGL